MNNHKVSRRIERIKEEFLNKRYDFKNGDDYDFCHNMSEFVTEVRDMKKVILEICDALIEGEDL